MALGEEILRERIEELQKTVAEIWEAVQKIALIEERFLFQKETTQRIFERLGEADAVIRKLEERVRSVEIQEPLHSQTGQWVKYFLTGIISSAGVVILERLIH